MIKFNWSVLRPFPEACRGGFPAIRTRVFESMASSSVIQSTTATISEKLSLTPHTDFLNTKTTFGPGR